MSHASGLAASIRGSTESDTFDLAGQNTSTITNNVTSAFREPLPISEMIRITFVTGAGKLARQKYDEHGAKAVTSALRDLGFEEDRGASCIKECGGSFKLQHDTGKNLKTVVVFPRIQEASSDWPAGEATKGSNSGEPASFFPRGSPKEMIALSSMKVFGNMVKSRCQSWSQKKSCLKAIGEIKTTLESLEGKLLQGTPLSDVEQTFYDQVPTNALDEKQAHLRDQMHAQVDEGSITSKEKGQLLEQVGERLEIVGKELADAEENKQTKKADKLKDVKEKSQSRKEKLSKISPKQAHPLKHQADIHKLLHELKPLNDLVEGSKGRLLSLKETQSLARKDDILEEVAELEESSRGWFEDEEAFQMRVKACHAACATTTKSKKKPTAKAASSSASKTTNAWVATGATKARGGASKAKTAPNKKGNAKGGGGVFAAMMLDSDSD